VDVAAVPNQQLSRIRSKRSRSRKAINKGNVPEGKQRRELELPSSVMEYRNDTGLEMN
jgi:hypothetical protein